METHEFTGAAALTQPLSFNSCRILTSTTETTPETTKKLIKTTTMRRTIQTPKIAWMAWYALLASRMLFAASTTLTTTLAQGTNTTTIGFVTMAPSTSKDKESDDLIHNRYVQIFFCVLYMTVFVLGVFGNVLVCWVVLRNPAMQTVTNIFITNLALSDILMCVLAVPFTPLYTFLGGWIFGTPLCHLVSYSQGCSIYISTLTLTSIAIDRYFVIIYPFHPRMKLSTCIAIIVSIWVISLLATMPYGMYMKVVSDEAIELNATDVLSGAMANFSMLAWNGTRASSTESNYGAYMVSPSSTSTADAYMQVVSGSSTALPPDTVSTITYCEENWPSEQYRKVFGSVTTILQFVLPFVIISICYIWVSVKLNARARAKPGSKSSRREEADRDRKKRTNRMLISMVAVFGLSWLPINVVNMFDDFYEMSNEWRYYNLFFFVAHSIAMSSTCYNPFLYAWLNENFRKEFKHVLPCFNPSNNNIINITRGYNRSERNTCGPRLQHGKGGDGAGGSMDDENGITQESCLPTKDKLLIIPREATYGNGNSGALSPHLGSAALVHSRHVDILLNDTDIRRSRRRANDDDEIDSGDEQTVEMRFCETPFVSSDNTTAISMLETSNEVECSGDGADRERRCN